MRSVQDVFEDYVKLNTRIPPEMLVSVRTIDEPGRLADTIVAHVALKLKDKQELLETPSPARRLERLGELMQGEIEIRQVEKKLRTRVKKQMEKQQKEFYLNEQMQAIQKELGGERDEFKNELNELEQKIKQKKMSKEAKERCLKELKKLKQMSPMSAEATVVRNYLDWVIALPWEDKTEDRHDINEAERILEAEHYGLKKVKERILEYLAVQSLVPRQRGPILCLVGPPGVGKTSLARSIAHATGRRFVRQSLGGVRDEAEIRGHRRTYIGALPGKIIQSLKKVGSQNPVFLLDEIDKMSMDFRGDPASALLEVLDPEQNNDVQRSLPRSRLRPVRRHVHHDGEPAARDPAAAAGSPRDHRAPRLHRVGEARDREAVPDPEAGRGQRRQGPRRHRGPTRRSPRSSIATPRKPACETSSARSRRCAARSPRSGSPSGRVAGGVRRHRRAAAALARHREVPRDRAARRRTRSASRTASRSRCSAATC